LRQVRSTVRRAAEWRQDRSAEAEVSVVTAAAHRKQKPANFCAQLDSARALHSFAAARTSPAHVHFLFSNGRRWQTMNNQTIAAFKKNAVIPFIVVGGAIAAIPIFLFLLARLAYVRAIKESLTPAAVRKLDAWRKGQAELASRPDVLSSFFKNGWLPASIKRVTAALDRLDRRKGF
jgi:hypothetical protein